MNKTLLTLLLTLSLLSSCQKKESTTTIIADNDTIAAVADTTTVTPTTSTSETTQQDFLAALEDICVEDDGVFKNCDELFDKQGSGYFFLIIPKAGAQNWYEAQSKNLKGATYEKNNALSAKVQSISKNDLSNDFDVWVFYTDKKYTQHVGMDVAYNIKNPHITNLYHLKSGKNNWEKVEDFDVKNDSDAQKEIQWRDDFITKAIDLSNQKSSQPVAGTVAVSAGWNGTYTAYFSYGDIGGQNAGWELDITITANKITARGDGYEISFLDELTAKETNNELVLNHLKNISGYKTGKTMNPEFILVKDNGKFYVKSKWIDGDVITKPQKQGYEIKKTE